MSDWNQKRALVCGGSKGIGWASAYQLADRGVGITLLARNEDDLKKAIAKLPKPNNQRHDYIACDTNNLNELKEQVLKKIENKGYDILINNSGGPAAGMISNAKNEEFVAAFQQHLIVNHTLTMLVVEYMKKNNMGRIINIISTSVKQPLPNLGVSNTIRAAVANWSKTMANELAIYGITVNNVLPGATATDRLAAIIQNKSQKSGKSTDEIREEMLAEIPMHRFAHPEEVAAAVCFLASSDASYITGINIPVDGGRTGSL